jgi:hypothetical protein
MMLPAADRSYDTFWCQSARWLALPAGDPVSLLPPDAASPGEDIVWRVMARDAGFAPLANAAVEVRVTAPDGRVETLTAVADAARDGSLVAHQRAAGAGLYRGVAEVRVEAQPPSTATASVLVGGADPEMADPRLNVAVLQRLASASGGRLIEPSDIAALPAQLRAAVPAAVVASRRDLWDNGWSFAALVLLLAGEWVLRRRWGLR